MTPAICLDNLSVRLSGTAILNNLSLSVASGSFLAILGPNGAGKSTLLQALPGLIRFQGSARLLGVEVGQASTRALGHLRRRMGYVPQLYSRPASVLPLSVREVVELGRAGVRGMGRRLQPSDHALCGRVMEQTELTGLADRSFAVLSGGEQRKVYLARALAQEPEILLLDEPAGHLDFRWQEIITRLIERIWKTSRLTVVMVTHDLSHLPAGANQVALLDKGRLLRLGPPRETLDPKTLSALYGLPLRVVESHGRFAAFPEDSA